MDAGTLTVPAAFKLKLSFYFNKEKNNSAYEPYDSSGQTSFQFL